MSFITAEVHFIPQPHFSGINPNFFVPLEYHSKRQEGYEEDKDRFQQVRQPTFSGRVLHYRQHLQADIGRSTLGRRCRLPLLRQASLHEDEERSLLLHEVQA